MIKWRAYLEMLNQDGVFLDKVTDDTLDASGDPNMTHFLWRRIDHRVLHTVLPFEPRPDSPVPRNLQRQIANTLRLPPEKYIFRPL